MKNKMMIAAMLLGLVGGSIFAGPVPLGESAWSPPNSGIQARFSFVEGDLVNGTRIIRVFLELRNTSDVANPQAPLDVAASLASFFLCQGVR